MPQHTFTAVVQDKPGVLVRAATLFSRRGYNIESLAVAPTGRPGRSRMTIVAHVEERAIGQLSQQLAKLVNVVEVLEPAPR
ncbi:acetolactate synthase small subunit [Streptomyces sp. TG1A-8]|uniref:acetolactate synthase small subunit n=1 Tax=Streptomyces sp. TG1A-8 TaxID=3051385 RepID=UPI00265C3CA6|nr:acetolactate synthase small subunit [Streptomyces sp. TG1A-8]MDO0925209.1 acetolactate synthase small subunit [Streptomyces sp. TG1A-8]